MKPAEKRCPVYFFVALLCLAPMLIQAQNEVTRKQNSLKGIRAVGFTVNLEAKDKLMERHNLDLISFQQSGIQALQEGGITLISDKEVQRSDEIPFLLMHINIMELNMGLIPFSISLYLYQPVKLTFNRDVQSTASTWESSILGVASGNRIDIIYQAANNLLNEFVSDYNKINQ